MAKIKLQVDGANALIKGLKKMSSDAVRIAEEEIEAGVQDIRTDAVAAAPVDTGRLRSSITAESQGLEGEVSTNVEYAGYMEFGTGGEVDVQPGWEDIAEQYRGSGERTVNITPRPFMRPAMEKNAPKIVERINTRINNDIIGGS